MSHVAARFLSAGIDIGADFSFMAMALPTQEIIGKPYRILHSSQRSLDGAIDRIRAAAEQHHARIQELLTRQALGTNRGSSPGVCHGTLLSIDCEEVENAYDVTNRQMADLDGLLYNAPMEYSQLVLSGEMEQYLSGAMFHGLED